MGWSRASTLPPTLPPLLASTLPTRRHRHCHCHSTSPSCVTPHLDIAFDISMSPCFLLSLFSFPYQLVCKVNTKLPAYRRSPHPIEASPFHLRPPCVRAAVRSPLSCAALPCAPPRSLASCRAAVHYLPFPSCPVSLPRPALTLQALNLLSYPVRNIPWVNLTNSHYSSTKSIEVDEVS
ncbi:hypothetical protein BC826DRAFT_188954 [Russula brevipes]|nr:hypothetical protein BC826DRAFT_188954 [Russula brevipes]